MHCAIPIICACMVVGLAGAGLLVYRFRSEAPRRSMQELKDCYDQNKDQFERAASTIGMYPDIVVIAKTPFFDKLAHMYYYETADGLHIETRGQLSERSVHELSQSVAFILKNLKFLKIWVQSGDIHFIEGSSPGLARGIVYVPVGEKPADMYITDLAEISDRWFSFAAR